jgi:single-stranded-DNA-specific exonuclease
MLADLPEHPEQSARLAAHFADFVRANPGPALCVHDLDADGLSSGILWQRCLERLGRSGLNRLIAQRDRNIWFGDYQDELRQAQPEALYVLDLGCQSTPPLPGLPTCVVDHHAPEPPGPDTLLLSSYDWTPTPAPTAWLMYRVASELVDMSDLDWLAVVGTEGDLGASAPFRLLQAMKGKHRRKDLSETMALVNAIRRSSQPRPELAAQALLEHSSPRQLVESEAPCVEALRQARRELQGELQRAKMAAPRFSGQVALVEVCSPCQVHPVIAQIWRGRLKKYYVIVANTGYQPGQVAFSARSQPPLKILELLRSLPEYTGQSGFGQGHDYASGGSLPVEQYRQLLRRLGFEAQTP